MCAANPFVHRNYALENAMEAANVPLMDLMDR